MVDPATLPWNEDAPEGRCWKCPDCPSWATLGGNAAFHTTQAGHGAPSIQEIPREAGEPFYDREIAPAVASLARRCREQGLSFIALVGYDDQGSVAGTVELPVGAPYLMRLADVLRQRWAPGGGANIDGLLTAICREARKTGHSSLFLKQLGVPLSPTEEPETAGGSL